MDPKNSRQARKRQEQQGNEPIQNTSVNKNYYIIIGILVVILGLLIFYIFNRDDKNDNLSTDDQTELADENNGVEEPVGETDSNDSTDSTETSETDLPEENDVADSEEGTEETTEDEAEDSVDTGNESAIDVGESVELEENAVHDPNHSINFNEGSADRLAINNEVMAVTGLGTDLIEWWIGGDGAGRVVATVSNPSASEVYEVYLQYGNGEWHATSMRRLSEIPTDFE